MPVERLRRPSVKSGRRNRRSPWKWMGRRREKRAERLSLWDLDAESLRLIPDHDLDERTGH